MIDKLNKILDSRIRLGVMAVLMSKDSADYLELKELLKQTDGNLASHIALLEKNEFLKIQKKFVGKKTSTSYSATSKGKKAFQIHIDAMEKIIKNLK